MIGDTKRCNQCKQYKPVLDFLVKPGGALYGSICIECRTNNAEEKRLREEQEKEAKFKKQREYQQEYQKEYKEKNAAEIRAYQREYQKARYHRMKRTIGEPPVSLAGDHPACPGCGGETRKGGRTWISGVHVQRWQCKQCGFTFTKTWDDNNEAEEINSRAED